MTVCALCLPASADSVTDELVPRIREGAAKFTEYIDISDIANKYGWTKEQTVDNVGLAYLYCPELFYVSNRYSVYYGSDGKYFASFTYLMNKSAADKAKAELDAAAKAAVEGINPEMSQLEKALYVHDYLILNCKYDYEHNGFDAYKCLVEGSAVCQGYSLAYMYILNEYLGMECTIAYSYRMKHAWNYVHIGGSWYHVDLTSDDPSSNYKDVSRDNHGYVLHNNFLISDELCEKTSELHRDWEIIGGFPAADSKIYDNAFWRTTTAQICFESSGRKCYYAYSNKEKDQSGKLITYICSYDFATGQQKKLLSVKSKWYVRRNSEGTRTIEYGKSYYLASWLKLAMIGDDLYFNTNNRVYRYNVKTNSFKKIYELNKGNNQIFGLTSNGKNIRLAYRLDVTYAENYVNLILS